LQEVAALVEQSHGLLNAMDLWAKKTAENSSPDAYAQMQSELIRLQSEWDSLQTDIANERSGLETSRMQLADYDDALKKELTWLRSVDRYLLDAADPCADLAERKSRLQRTKVCQADKIFVFGDR
jgi:hypothetical protein